MRNHPVFKFLALLMCAVSLFGAVASVCGMVVMAEGDLYNKSVDQMLSSRLQTDGTTYADYLALRYASVHMGGVPEELAESRLGHDNWFYHTYDQNHYGYAILDAEGNELVGYNAELKDATDLAFREAYTVEGRYMHLVSLESQEAAQLALRQDREALYDAEPILTLYDNAIPAQGVVVSYASFLSKTGELLLDAYYDGNSTIITTYYTNDGPISYYDHDSQLGMLFFDQTRHLVFHSFVDTDNADPDQAVGEVCFQNADGLNLRIRSDSQVGTLYYTDNGYIGFISTEAALPAEAAEETVAPTVPETIAETIPETVPETIAETVPPTAAETAPEETWVEETWAESSASAVPEEGAWVQETQAPAVETTPETLPPETTVPATEEPLPLATEETLPPATEPELINGKPLNEYQLNAATYYDRSTGETMDAEFIYLAMPTLTVELYVKETALRYAPVYDILRLIQPYRNYLLPVAAMFALLFVLCAVYLVAAAGRGPGQEGIRAGGLNRLPLDVYFLAAGSLICLFVLVPLEMADEWMRADFYLCCGLVAGGIFLACLIFVSFCFALAAQWKTGNGFWYKNSLCVRFLIWLVWAAVTLEKLTATKVFPWLWNLTKRLGSLLLRLWKWLLRSVKSAARTCFQGLQQFMALLPLTWQWLLGGMLFLLLGLLIWANRGDGWGFVWLLLGIGLVLYISHSYGILADSTRRMSQGDLNTKVDDKNLLGCFKRSAADLNALADVAVVAAQKQLKSERMKTELITNVSHDIKTPLTSIINYVDLLQKPHTDEEQAQYLEVLDRQSQRLKKLIDDLMDMSKANTGNMAVEITRVDAVESVNQALGEFADKLERAQVSPVFRHSSDSVPMMADGKLVWRVLSNLLGNAVKYAMPGTRLYVDLITMEGKVVLSLKNISREELNVDAAELMERFVRGDDSRNTEGSGLGLNIAKSLMELQKGQLQLLVDGDLFKVTLTFPGA